MIICVDFDKTLSLGTRYPHIGKPNTELFSLLNSLQNLGHTIILWTCREGEPLDKAVIWCKENGLEFDYVNQNVPWLGFDCRKIVADWYIDDCAIHVNDIKILKAIVKQAELDNRYHSSLFII